MTFLNSLTRTVETAKCEFHSFCVLVSPIRKEIKSNQSRLYFNELEMKASCTLKADVENWELFAKFNNALGATYFYFPQDQ